MRLKHIGIALAVAGLTVGAASAKEGADQYPHGSENWSTQRMRFDGL